MQPTHILDLLDDCLVTVFSYLPTVDLCAVMDSCQRFETLAKEQFMVRYRHNPVIFAPKFDDSHDRADFSDAVKVVHYFGSLIRALSVHNIIEKEDSYYWEDVMVHCSALVELKVTGCALRFLCYHQQKPETIQSLILNKCLGDDHDLNDTIYSLPNLKRLTIEYGHYGMATAFLRRQIPALEEITVRCVRSRTVDLNVVLPFFIASNAQLKRIHFNFNYVKCDILETIAMHSRDLESLSLQLYENHYAPFPEDIAKLRRLQHLSELQISCAVYDESIRAPIAALAEKNLLHTLSISDAGITIDLCLALKKMTTLKTLKLVKMSVEVDQNLERPLEVLLNRSRLEHLHLISCKGIVYKHIVGVVEVSKALRSLTFSCDCACTHIDGELFEQLIAARKLSGASSALDLYLPLPVLKVSKQNVGGGLSNDQCVQLKKMDNAHEYVHAFAE